MPKIDNLYFAVKPLVALAPKANVDTDADNGPSLDGRSYEQFNAGNVLIHVGAATGGPSAFALTYTLQHSDDNSTWVTAPGALSSARANATLVATAAGVYQLPFEPGRLKRYKRLIRSSSVTGGTNSTVPNGATFLFGDSRKAPV